MQDNMFFLIYLLLDTLFATVFTHTNHYLMIIAPFCVLCWGFTKTDQPIGETQFARIVSGWEEDQMISNVVRIQCKGKM